MLIKVSGSDRVDRCVCVWKAEEIVTGHRSFNLELANYFFQHVCFAHPEETVELFFVLAVSVNMLYGRKRNRFNREYQRKSQSDACFCSNEICTNALMVFIKSGVCCFPISQCSNVLSYNNVFVMQNA